MVYLPKVRPVYIAIINHIRYLEQKTYYFNFTRPDSVDYTRIEGRRVSFMQHVAAAVVSTFATQIDSLPRNCLSCLFPTNFFKVNVNLL